MEEQIVRGQTEGTVTESIKWQQHEMRRGLRTFGGETAETVKFVLPNNVLRSAADNTLSEHTDK